MPISLPLDSAAARQLLGDLGRQLDQFPGEMEKVLVRALNRTLKGASTQATRLITRRYSVKQAEAKRKIKETKASKRRLYIRLEAQGRPILLSKFGAKSRTVSKKRSAYTYDRGGKTVSVGQGKSRKYQAVSVKVLKSGKRKLVKGGFLGKPKNGIEMIFARADKKMEVLRGPSLYSFLAQPHITDLIRMTAEERMARELQHEAAYRLSKLL